MMIGWNVKCQPLPIAWIKITKLGNKKTTLKDKFSESFSFLSNYLGLINQEEIVRT